MRRAKTNRRDRPPSFIAAVLQRLSGGGNDDAREGARVRALLETRLSAHLLKDVGLGEGGPGDG